MYFSKFPHRSNFSFVDSYSEADSTIAAGGKQMDVSVRTFDGGITHVQVIDSERWGENRCLEALSAPEVSEHRHIKVAPGFKLQVLGKRGKTLLKGTFGVSGEASIFVFSVEGAPRFYGMGEKTFGRMELSGVRAKFWNTDVWGDFHIAHYADHPTDPPYFTTPYVIVKVADEYVGLLLHNPYPAFMETPGTEDGRAFEEWKHTSPDLILGSEGGEPNLWILNGPTLRELTRKLQRLVGTTPLPPAWALGYHQSRWGYRGHDDLVRLDEQFAKHKIPCDGLWMDLDYMDGYRIFQTSSEAFPLGAQATADTLAVNQRRIVPILDPGVKFETGYRVYDDGNKHEVFCQNAEGKEFVGLVWPGETVFPDFTLPKVRSWWAGYVEEFARSGFGASWLDMNDPSTGPVDPQGMRFRHGKELHAAYHNQYALGMQMATYEGFRRARPEERPFLLSRSGFIGSSKKAAIWTGDNLSNYFYLSISIPTSVNLSLSGVPFNGPDIGGFGDSVSDGLMIDWVKANFLFPFFRNHCAKGQRDQEPFNFPEPVMALVRRYIRLRYKLIPYLYNLFIAQEEDADPILRPLFYEFDDAGLDRVNDQFMVGPWVIQAPFVQEKAKSRPVLLPGNDKWYDAVSGDWLDAGAVEAKNDRGSTPMYIRAGAILPMQAGTPVDNTKELRKVHLHIFIPPSWSGDSSTTYKADDGISYRYRSGERSSISVRLASANGNLAISVEEIENGFGPIEPTFVIHGDPKSVRLNGGEGKLKNAKVVLTGKPLKVQIL
ncbi:MAG: glycoside hydrolase family 31 protein [Fimbriimonas sp.]|nr:glycoside hydrolase family 31 protein [Fimbriimonas sp.]